MDKRNEALMYVKCGGRAGWEINAHLVSVCDLLRVVWEGGREGGEQKFGTCEREKVHPQQYSVMYIFIF